MERAGMSCSEAGKIGAIASLKYQHERKQKNTDEYNKNPKTCEHCGNAIPYERRENRFCSSSCAAAHNNKGRVLSIQQKYDRSIACGGDGHKYLCINCGKLRVRVDEPFCSEACREEYAHKHQITSKNLSKSIAGINSAKTVWEKTKASIKETGEFPHCETTNDTRRPVVRKYLEETAGHKCAICGIAEWNGQPVPLVVDHLDGDSTNHSVDNLRLICYNCDAQTETFKRRGNRTSTRTWRAKYTKPQSK